MAITMPSAGLLGTGKISYEDFLHLDIDASAEWIDGEVEYMSPATNEHDTLSGFGYRMVSDWAEAYDLGEVRHQRYQMKLDRTRTGREPDVLFLRKENLSRVHRTYIDGPADLVIEVVSKDSEERDRETKFLEYQRAGVPEYWIWNSEEPGVEFYQLGEDGKYQRISQDADGVYRSKVLEGFWLNVEWVNNVPRMADVRRAWGW